MQFQKKDKRGNYNYNDEQPPSSITGRIAGGQRSPLRLERDTGESGYGEMLYLDPNDVNFRRNQAMSPVTEGRQSQIQARSPNNRFGQSVLAAVRSELNERNDTAQVMGRSPLPTLNVTLENKRRERLERSPKTINIGDTEKDIEYNIRTLNPRRSPKNINMAMNNNTMYNTNTNYNEPGNIFLDQPMQSGSFLQGQGETSTYQGSPMAGMSMLQNKPSNDYLNGNSREITYSMNPRDLREPLPNLMNKMSPNKNVDDESSSENNNKGNDTATQLKDLKTQMDRNANMAHNDGDGMIEQPSTVIQSDIRKMEEYAKGRESRETMTEGEIKKLVRQMTKGYDPRKGTEGRLISTSQTIIPGANEEIFNDRYKVLQKMNKLSTILLAKNRGSVGGSPDQTLNRSIEEQRKTFDRNTLNSTIPGRSRRNTLNRSPQNKFLYLSLAMISSKGPNCEDRIILRKMRFDKGGVVDLAQEAQKKKNKFTVKKVQRKSIAGGSRGYMNYNPKYREKAAKVVQGWWRDLKERYQKILDKIILIQSAWRGRWLRKYIYDIIYLSFLHQRFCDILEKVMVSHVRPIVWEELFGYKKWAKERLARLLLEKDKRFTFLRLRPWFNRWRDAAKFLSKRNLKSKRLVNKKELDEKNKKLMSKYFNEWALRSNLIKFIGKTRDLEAQKKKFYGVMNLFNGTKNLFKRTGLKTVDPKIKSYLAKRIRNNAIKALILKSPKYSTLVKRKYFNKWNNQTGKMKLKDFKNKVFGNMLGHLNSRMDRSKMKDCLGLWRSKLPKDTYLNYARGTELLQRFTFRKTHKDPLKALAIKTDYENEKEGILRMLGVKARYIKNHWRDYLFKWRQQAQKMKDREIQNALYKSLLTTVLKKRKYRILSNRFAQWKKQPKLDLDALFDRYKAMNDMIRRTWNYVLKPDKQKFLAGVKKTIHPKSYKLAVNRLLDQYLNKDRTMLRYFLYKWRDQCRNYEIFDLKMQLIRYLCGANDGRNNRNSLARRLGKWKLAVNTGRLNDEAEKMKNITHGFDKLNKMYANREIEFMIRLFRLMNKDHRPKFIEGVVNRLFRPRGTVRDCFNKWRRVNDIENNNANVRKLKGKVLKSNAHRLNERQNRDALLRGFFKWLNMCRNPEDYYPKIAKGINLINHAMKNNQCRDPFDKLKTSKNYARRLIPLLKNNKHLQDKLNRDLMKDRFNKWKAVVLKDNIKDLKSNIIFKTKNNFMANKRGQVLQKYFTKWKVYRPKKLDSDFYKGLMILQNYCEKPYRKPVYEAFKDKVEDILKRQGLNALFGTSKTFRNRLLHNAMLKWWKNAVLTDPNKFAKIKSRLRRLVQEKAELPLEKAFHRWIRALAKNPDFVNILNASDLLKKTMIKNNRPAFEKIRNYISPEYIRNKIFKNVLPNSKLAKERAMRNAFNKWKINAKNMGIRDLKANLLSKLYGNTKGALRERFLRKYFKRWSYKEPERKPLDLFGVLQSMDIIHKMLANKYMKGFFDNMKEYGTKKFLRSLLLGTSKYHKRRMKPYFDRWRSNANKLSTKLLKQEVSSRFMARTNNYRTSYKMQNLLRGKFNQWKRIVQKLREKANKEIPEGVENLKIFTIKKNAPEFLDNLKDLAFRNHKKKALKALPPKREKCQNKNMKKFFDRWKGQVTRMILRDMSNRMKLNQMRHLVKLFETGPMKYFLLWKFKAGVQRSTSPIVQGIDKLRKTIIADPFKKFIHRADMMNLVIPRGMSTQSALIKKKRNLAKSISLRNVAMRPFWNKWKYQTAALRSKAHRRQLFNKIMTPQLRNLDKLILRRGYNTWKDQVDKMNTKEKLQQLQMKLMHLLCGKTIKDYLKKYMNRWQKNCGMANQKLRAVKQAMDKIRLHSDRKVAQKMRELLLHQSKFDRVKAMLINAMRNNDRGNLAYCFNKWKLITQKLRELFLKLKLLKNLTSKQDYKNDDYRKNRLHEVLLHWRIRCAPKDYLERMRRIREGSKLLKKGVRKPHSRQIFDGIKDRANERYLNYLLNKIIGSIGPMSDLLNKRRAFNTWKDRLSDTDAMRRKMIEMLNKYLMSEPIHEKMIHEPEQDIVNAMKAYYELKKNNARTIGNFTRGLLNIKRQFAILKRNKLLRKKVLSLDMSLYAKYKIMLSSWLRAANIIKTNENAQIIQRFLKSRLNNPSDKRKRIVRGGDFLDLYVKRVTFGKIYETAKDNLMKKVLRRHINDQDALNRKMLHGAFTKWKDLMPIMRQNDAATKIENNYRNLRSRRKLGELKRRKAMLEYLTMKIIAKYGDKKAIALHQWNKIAQIMKCHNNAQIIQNFVGDKLREYLKSKAQVKLFAMFRHATLKELEKAMKKASRIIGDKGEVMFRTLEDIYIRRPFEKICEGMKWIGRIKALKKVQPKIHEALRKYWIPFYMRKWKQNTWDDMINKLIRMQNWIRGRMAILRAKAKQRREALLNKYLIKLAADTELKLRIPFKVWDKKTKLNKLNANAENIQRVFRGMKGRKNAEKLLSQARLNNMFTRTVFNKLADAINDADKFSAPLRKAIAKFDSNTETRYTTDNLIDFANDALRNKYLSLITGKRAYTDALSALRRYFDRWRQFNRFANESATKLQCATRLKSARRKRHNLEKLKKNLFHIFLRYSDDEKLILKSGFREWLARARMLKCQEMSGVIQQFLKPRLAKLLNDKFKDFFGRNALKMTHRRLNQAAKVDKLQKALLKPNVNYFLNALRNKDKYDRLRLIFAKNFAHLDDELMKLLMETYLKRWKENADKLNKQRNDAATTIENGYRTYRAKKLLADKRAKRDRLMRLLLKMINDRDLQKQVGFNIWRANANSMKLSDSSKIIQNFMNDVRAKLAEKKRQRKHRNMIKGLEKLMNMKFFLREPLQKIISESNRKIFTKFNEDLMAKRRNHLKAAYDAIREEEQRYLLNRLFGIPTTLKHKILRKAMNKWKDNADRTARRHAAERIQKNYRLYHNRMIKNKIQDLLKDRLSNIALRNSDMLRYYFNIWKKNAKKATVLRAGKKINKFVNNKLKDARAKQRWHKLSDLLNMLNGNYQALNMLKRMRQFMAIHRFAAPIEHAIKDDGFSDLKDFYNKAKMNDFLRFLFGNFDKRNEIMNLKRCMRTWRDKAMKLKAREEALNNAVDVMDTRRKIIGADTINAACLVKKLFKTIPKIRALDFFDRLRRNAEAKKQYEDFANTLKSAHKDLVDQTKSDLAQKVYRLFIYRKLNKMFNGLQGVLINKVKPEAGRDFLEALYDNLKKNSYFNYDGQKSSTFKCPSTSLSFKKRVTNPKNIPLKNDKSAIVKKILPYFVDYINNKMKNRKKYVVDKLIDNDRYGRFCSLYKKFSAKKKIPQKEDLIGELKARSNYMDTQGSYLIRLFKLLRKKWVDHVCTSMVEPNKIYKLLYLLRITYMHKKVAKQRYIRELTRKWRFAAFVKKMARKKLELMYKNLHVSYLQMANEVFGDEDDNPSVMKEFERFGTNIGMFSSEEPSLNDELSRKYIKTVQKKYVFKPNVIDDDTKKIKETKQEEDEENHDFYVDQDSETTGKYNK